MKSTQDILLAQLEADVAEAKLACERELKGAEGTSEHKFVDAIHNLIGRTVVQWWLARSVKNMEDRGDASEYEERRKARIAAYAQLCGRITAMSGPMTMEVAQMTIMELQGQCQGMWRALKEAGIVTESVKQDFLDMGVIDLAARVEAASTKIMVPGNGSVARA